MPELIITLSIIGAILIVLLIAYFLALYVHNKAFHKRFDPNPLVRYYVPEEYEGLMVEDVSFKLDDKYNLSGSIYKYDNYDQNKIVIYAHGMWSCTKSYMQDIEYIARAGFQVLGFDYYSTDRSEGDNQRSFSHGIKSLDCAIKYIKSRFNNISIYVVGHSWGGFNTMNIVKYHPDVKKIVALSGFISPSIALKKFIPNPFKIISPFLNLIEFFKCPKFSFNNSIKSLKRYEGQALIIHSNDDNTVLYKDNYLKIESKLKNKNNINFITTTKKNHMPHYTEEAIIAFSEFKRKTKEIEQDKIKDFMNSTDFHKLGELDPTIMDKICEFLLK